MSNYPDPVYDDATDWSDFNYIGELLDAGVHVGVNLDRVLADWWQHITKDDHGRIKGLVYHPPDMTQPFDRRYSATLGVVGELGRVGETILADNLYDLEQKVIERINFLKACGPIGVPDFG